ncbi:hypothetical protein [Streptomyces lydicus]|uniref:hypothetical protein n=1 Tax=Streptomyces lydicus TaxID=47763 RepID=UPI0037D7237C
MIPHLAMAFISAALMTAAIVLRTAAMGWWWLSRPSVVWALLTGAVALPLWNLAQLLPLGGSALSPAKIAVFLALVAAEAVVILLPGTRRRRQQLQAAKRLDDRARPIWTSVAARLTEHDAPGWVRLHFEGAEQAIGRRDGHQAGIVRQFRQQLFTASGVTPAPPCSMFMRNDSTLAKVHSSRHRLPACGRDERLTAAQ